MQYGSKQSAQVRCLVYVWFKLLLGLKQLTNTAFGRNRHDDLSIMFDMEYKQCCDH